MATFLSVLAIIRSALLFVVLVFFSIGYYLCARPVCFFISAQWQHTCTNGWSHAARLLLRVIVGVRFRVHGLEALDRTRPALFFVRHESALETLALKTILPYAVFVLKKELLAIPIIGTGLKLNQSIAIDRAGGRQTLRYMQAQMAERIARGYSVIVFPEGTRTMHHQPGTVKKGICLIAAATDIPVHLVSHNAGLLWAKKSWLVRPGVVDVHISQAHQFYGQPTNDITRTVSAFFAEHL